MSISINLRLTGDALNPETITAILKVEPTIARKKGDRRISTSKEIVSKFGLWTWKILDQDESIGINQQIEQLGNTFKDLNLSLKDLPHVDEAWIDICVVNDTGRDTCLLWDFGSIEIFHRLRLPVEVTVYSTSPEQSPVTDKD